MKEEGKKEFRDYISGNTQNICHFIFQYYSFQKNLAKLYPKTIDIIIDHPSLSLCLYRYVSL